jgi:hypothetical protein
MASKLKLLDVRLSFPDLFEAVEFQVGDKKPRYNASFLVVPGSANDKAIQAAITAACVEKLGAKAKAKQAAWEKSGDVCYTDGNAKEYDGYADMMVLSSHRRAVDGPVGVYSNVIDPQTGKVAVLTAVSGKPYAGCYVNATVEIYITEGKFPGIRCGLVAVQYKRDGDAFSGSKPASPDDFEEEIGEGSDADAIA